MKNNSKIPIEEKIKLTSGDSNWTFFESPYIGNKHITVADGPHGVRTYKKVVDETNFLALENLNEATLFPSAVALASTFNPDLIKQVGKTIGRECIFYDVDVLLGPGINLKRSPLGGRNFEYYSEDPFLTYKIGAAFVNGIQSEGVGACIKHFALNEQETMRRFVNSSIDQRTLHEMYLSPFRKIIEDAKPWMIMSSYNKINGDYASESSFLLKDVLRDKWQYKGAVVSDWNAVQHKVKSIKNGMNIEMPGPSSFDQEVVEALKNNELNEKEIDQSLMPLFDLYEKIQSADKNRNEISFENHHETAVNVAREAVVLLKNDGTLPLNMNDMKLGIIGDFAKNPRINGGGSASTRPFIQETPFDYFKGYNGILFAKGYEEDDTNDSLLKEVQDVCEKSDIVLFFTGTTESSETEGQDRANIDLPEGHQKVYQVIKKHAKKHVILLSMGSALDLRDMDQHANAILANWFLGGASGKALHDILSGHINPSGKLTETFPLELAQTPHYPIYPEEVEVNYSGDIVNNGYRYYDTKNIDVLYPFGYGLSYSTFELKHVNLSLQEDHIYIEAKIKNTSQLDGKEVIQVYVGKEKSLIVRPKKELKAFKKVLVKGASSQHFEITIKLDELGIYDESREDFIVEDGEYTFYIGTSIKDICHKQTINIQTGYFPKIKMTLEYPYYFFAKYYPKWAKWLTENYKELMWFEKEEPMLRLIKRYFRSENKNEKEYENIILEIQKDLEK